MKSRDPIFKKSIIAFLLAIIVCFFYLKRADNPKESFQKVEGYVIALNKRIENYPGKDSTKFRYLYIDNYPKPFEIFIGNDAGDFKPKYEILDSLKQDDLIKIYFDENSKTANAPVNNLAFFIDRGQQTIFIEGNSKKNLVYGLIIFCVIFSIILYILKLKKKIN